MGIHSSIFQKHTEFLEKLQGLILVKNTRFEIKGGFNVQFCTLLGCVREGSFLPKGVVNIQEHK